jgi:antitoxin (DNA-binding transcriptional repressor) of toxin-antitoxin stability system
LLLLLFDEPARIRIGILTVVHRGPPRDVDKVASGSYIVCVRAVGLKVLKNKLSEYVRLAASGEVVLVTDRDRVVAELVPPREGRSPLLADAQLAEAVRRGWLTPPLLVPVEPPPRIPVASLAQILRELEEDRAER